METQRDDRSLPVTYRPPSPFHVLPYGETTHAAARESPAGRAIGAALTIQDDEQVADAEDYDWLRAMETSHQATTDGARDVPFDHWTAHAEAPGAAHAEPGSDLDPFDAGFLIGILVGEGHFGGDGRQPQVTLRMHTDHEALFRWLMERFPETRLYGPYDHSGRRYYQWMARSAALRERLFPLLERWLRPEHSGRVWERFQAMKRAYARTLQPSAVPSAPEGGAEGLGYTPGGAERAAGRARAADRPRTHGGTVT